VLYPQHLAEGKDGNILALDVLCEASMVLPAGGLMLRWGALPADRVRSCSTLTNRSTKLSLLNLIPELTSDT